jgi:hypothetical protein
LQNESNVNNQIDGRCPIHFAADFGHNEIIEFLLGKGADVNVSDSIRETRMTIHIALSCRQSIRMGLPPCWPRFGKDTRRR